MNIAIFASAFHPSLGGVEELCRQLAHELMRQGNGVIVLTNRWPRNLPKQEIVEGIPLYRLPFRTPGAGAKSDLSYTLTWRLISIQTQNILRRHGIDVIHVQCVGGNAHYATLASRALDLPLVVTLQGELTMDATKLFERSAFARQTLRNCLAAASASTACSRQTLEEAQQFYGRELNDARVIYNGVDLNEFSIRVSPVPKRPYVLAIGRFVEQKGFDVLLRAFAALRDESDFPFDLILAGDGPKRDELKALVAELGIGPRVSFTGRVDRAQAASLFSGCSFFVLPSRHEPFGIVNLEAMAAGKAIIATRAGGVPEIVDEQVGLLVTPDDAASLAQAMRSLGSNETLRQKLGENARRRAPQFSWPNIARQYLSVYESVLLAPVELPEEVLA